MTSGKLICLTCQIQKCSITVTRSYLLSLKSFQIFAWAVPLKNKTGKSILKAFAKILNGGGLKTLFLYTDRGLEFANKLFQRYPKKKQIHF